MPTHQKLAYRKARLVEGTRWYILYYYQLPASDKEKRVRKTYNLNRIADLVERRKRADLICIDINAKLRIGIIPDAPTTIQPLQLIETTILIKAMRDGGGLTRSERDVCQSWVNILRAVVEREDWTTVLVQRYHAELLSICAKVRELQPLEHLQSTLEQLLTFLLDAAPAHIVAEQSREVLYRTNLVTAVKQAYELKSANASKKSRENYDYYERMFTDFLQRRGWQSLPVGSFDQGRAQAFLDDALTYRKVSNTTYNNYRNSLRAVFALLKQRRYCAENPFERTPRRAEAAKKRRAFNTDERQIVAQRIRASDRQLLLAIQLQYHCFVRPKELLGMRIEMIDFERSVLNLPGSITKNGKSALITIPRRVLEEWRYLQQYRSTHFVFGAQGKPSGIKSVSKNVLSGRHKNILRALHAEGELANIEGLQFYSWKDTGALELFRRKVNILEIRQQLRHADLTTTQKYCQSLHVINHEIKELDNPILPRHLPTESPASVD